MYFPPRKMPPIPHHPQNVSKAAGWKALSLLSVLIIRFLTALLIVDHIACLQLECLLLLPNLDLPCLQIFLHMQHFVGWHASPDE